MPSRIAPSLGRPAIARWSAIREGFWGWFLAIAAGRPRVGILPLAARPLITSRTAWGGQVVLGRLVRIIPDDWLVPIIPERGLTGVCGVQWLRVVPWLIAVTIGGVIAVFTGRAATAVVPGRRVATVAAQRRLPGVRRADRLSRVVR